MKTILQAVAEGLSERKIKAMLIGGHALSAYGVARQTADVDFLVSESDSGILENILLDVGYKEKGRTKNSARFAHPSPYLMDVDILLVDTDTFRKMANKSRGYRVGAVSFRAPCMAHLIALKMHAIRNNPKRELRDLADVVELINANPGEVSAVELREICRRYGPAGIYKKLEGYI